ncbi:hypothetical protein NC651_031187 [Populus alba x Populus x berolinensis]|nr:hypothetical protein NC651_031187 [Populus alba x Populus x berolinensis]
MELPGIAAEAAKHCDVLRRASEAGGLLVDTMTDTSDGSKENSSSVPLMVVENGRGSPCIDLMQGSSELAAAAEDADLLDMVKKKRLAEKPIKGNIHDCVCRYEAAS